jgi:hypothetical protein
MYNPTTGRWTTPDPAAAPWTNLQTYVGENPLTWSDPSGLTKSTHTIRPFSDQDTSVTVSLEDCDCCVADISSMLSQLKRVYRAVVAVQDIATDLAERISNFTPDPPPPFALWSNIYNSLLDDNDHESRRVLNRMGYGGWLRKRLPGDLAAKEAATFPDPARQPTPRDRAVWAHRFTQSWIDEWVNMSAKLRGHLDKHGFTIKCHTDCRVNREGLPTLGWVRLGSALFSSNPTIHICCDLINGDLVVQGRTPANQDLMFRETLLHELVHAMGAGYLGHHGGDKGLHYDPEQWEKVASLGE